MSKEKIDELNKRKRQISLGGGQAAIDKQHAKGKYTARERIEKLFDEGSFVELDTFVEHRSHSFGMDKKRPTGDGVVIGYGTIDGRLVYCYSQDFTVIGGSLGEMHAAKIVKAQTLAAKVGAPIIGINDSGGARIQEGVGSLKGFGDIFFANSMASGVIPQISVIMGPCAGGATYSPALTDFIFMVDKTSQMFITGPEVIKTVTGEIVSADTLGGARTHNATSGVAHFMDETEDEAIAHIKELLSYLPSNNMENAPRYDATDDLNRVSECLNELIPENPNKPYDILEIIKELSDDGQFFEVQPLFARNIVIGYIRLNGQTIGVVANQPNYLAGCLDIDASDKAARFIRTCDSFNIPLLTLVDVPGFLPGTGQEHNGIIRHGAKMLYAYSEATVPKVTIILRKAYGGAYIAMCSKHLKADLVYAWPNAEIAVMGPDGAANIIFRKEIKDSDDPVTTRAKKIEEYRAEVANPYTAAGLGYVDDILEPSITRKRLISAFDMLSDKRENRPAKKHGNMPL
ncbi:methylmalonyl-CoA carboxyltransferase [Tuanshanicoccus lijuaniae]|uniref:acyl-CoA carboxylase subunit beta n=1 Tax=Aerococcaceae bacterium zg-1292 TaxID=2774330 RepID=UPI001937624C|nr:methylmalonyl-CoA carboxyltransferase [Aerococcaceae bacterium zg-1292]QQA37097.1 methylmalonyl-CoA carboxyltransferase [Aerococcaceae bacterium zg-1292]